MDHFSFTEICLHQLKMSGVHEGEKLIVLPRGNERLDYADVFMAAGMRLGAKMYYMRLPPVPPAGAWALGQTGLAAMPEAVEALEAADMLIDCIFLLFSPEQVAIQASGTRILTTVDAWQRHGSSSRRNLMARPVGDFAEIAEAMNPRPSRMRNTTSGAVL